MTNLNFQRRKLFRHEQEEEQEQEPLEDADAHQPEAKAAQPEEGPRKQRQGVILLLGGGGGGGSGRPGRLQVCHCGGEGGGEQLRQPDLELRRAADDREVLHRPGKCLSVLAPW